MEKRRRVRLAVLLTAVAIAVSVSVPGAVWVYHMTAVPIATAPVQGVTDLETLVDESEGYYNKSEESPEFFGRNTGIVLPEGTKPVYMIHSEGIFPPYRLEAHVVIPNSEIEPFVQDNAFEVAPEDSRDLSFLQLSDDLPPDLRPARTEGDIYIRTEIDSTNPVWWTYVLNGKTGDLWIQYNTE